MAPARCSTWLAAALVCSRLHCSSQHNGETAWSPQQQWTSRHFVFHARVDDGSVNAGVMDYLEANATLIATNTLHIDPSPWGPIQYFKYRDQADFKAGSPSECSSDSGACTLAFSDGRVEVHSPLAVDGHELHRRCLHGLPEHPGALVSVDIC
jgi:hypothetical protein